MCLYYKQVIIQRHCEPKKGEVTDRFMIYIQCIYLFIICCLTLLPLFQYIKQLINMICIFPTLWYLNQHVGQRRKKEDHQAVTLIPGWRYLSCREDDEVLTHRDS